MNSIASPAPTAPRSRCSTGAPARCRLERTADDQQHHLGVAYRVEGGIGGLEVQRVDESAEPTSGADGIEARVDLTSRHGRAKQTGECFAQERLAAILSFLYWALRRLLELLVLYVAATRRRRWRSSSFGMSFTCSGARSVARGSGRQIGARRVQSRLVRARRDAVELSYEVDAELVGNVCLALTSMNAPAYPLDVSIRSLGAGATQRVYFGGTYRGHDKGGVESRGRWTQSRIVDISSRDKRAKAGSESRRLGGDLPLPTKRRRRAKGSRLAVGKPVA